MKKFLLTVALILAVVTSLTAGTMAAYNVQLQAVNDNVTAKTFEFSGEGTNFDTTALHIAPGEEGWYKYVVTGNAEVPMKVTSAASFNITAAPAGVDASAIKDRFTFEVYKDGKEEGNKVTLDADGKTSIDWAVGENTATYYLRVAWKYSGDDATDTALKSTAAATTTLGTVTFSTGAVQATPAETVVVDA